MWHNLKICNKNSNLIEFFTPQMPRGINLPPKVHQRGHIHHSIRNCRGCPPSYRTKQNWPCNRLFRRRKEKLYRIFARIETSFSYSHSTERFEMATWTWRKRKCWIVTAVMGIENKKLIDCNFFVILYPKRKFLLKTSANDDLKNI